jgi:hypothetical protein
LALWCVARYANKALGWAGLRARTFGGNAGFVEAAIFVVADFGPNSVAQIAIIFLGGSGGEAGHDESGSFEKHGSWANTKHAKGGESTSAAIISNNWW